LVGDRDEGWLRLADIPRRIGFGVDFRKSRERGWFVLHRYVSVFLHRKLPVSVKDENLPIDGGLHASQQATEFHFGLRTRLTPDARFFIRERFSNSANQVPCVTNSAIGPASRGVVLR
jgi:hypothetical protein